MATATLITIPVYKINSNQIQLRSLFPYGNPIAFGGATLNVQPNTGSTLALLQGGTTALLYSMVRSSATGNTMFFSNLTVAQIVTLANA